MYISESKNDKGFTLVELLVVIAIIAVITSIAVTNFLGARERARDVKKKAEVAQLKNALRLYYNDYALYPGNDGSNDIVGCGTTAVPTTCLWGGTFDKDGTTYMRALPTYDAATTFTYTQINSGDDFRLVVEIDNQSDSDISGSQAKCGFPTPTPGVFMICAD